MSAEFTLRVPADPQFRGLANEVVARYVEVSGIPEPDRPPLAASFAAALDRVSPGETDQIDVVCTAVPGGFDITVRCGGRSAVVHHPQPAARS
jgi:hypothetical protein